MPTGVIIMAGLVAIVWLVTQCIMKVVKMENEHLLAMEREKADRAQEKV